MKHTYYKNTFRFILIFSYFFINIVFNKIFLWGNISAKKSINGDKATMLHYLKITLFLVAAIVNTDSRVIRLLFIFKYLLFSVSFKSVTYYVICVYEKEKVKDISVDFDKNYNCYTEMQFLNACRITWIMSSLYLFIKYVV